MIDGQLWSQVGTIMFTIITNDQAEVLKYMKMTVFQEESLIDNLAEEWSSQEDARMDVRTVLDWSH